jgi:hypothetical protein
MLKISLRTVITASDHKKDGKTGFVMSDDKKTVERSDRVSWPYTVSIIDDMSTENPHWNIVLTKDISASGILFHFTHYLELGSPLRFRIALPACEPLECGGMVVRNLRKTLFGPFGSTEPAVCAVAAVFKNLSEDERALLSGFLAKYDAEVLHRTGPKTSRTKRLDYSFPFWIKRVGQDDWDPVPMRNISESGVLFACSELLEIGTEISFRMMFPFVESAVICRGSIVRIEDQTRPDSDVKIFNIGVHFSDLEEAVRRKLHDYAEQFGRG